MLNYNHVEEQLMHKGDAVGMAVLYTLKLAVEGITRERLSTTIFPTDTEPSPSEAETHDRAIRKAISRLRNLGVVILSSSQETGYRLAGENDFEQVRKFVNEQVKAAKSRMKVAKAVKRAYGLKDIMPMELGR